MSGRKLTAQQRRVLAYLVRGEGHGRHVSVPELANALVAAREGVAQTASSLVRRGLVERIRQRLDGHVYYGATDAGRAAFYVHNNDLR